MLHQICKREVGAYRMCITVVIDVGARCDTPTNLFQRQYVLNYTVLILINKVISATSRTYSSWDDELLSSTYLPICCTIQF
jgi:hypothetical protein